MQEKDIIIIVDKDDNIIWHKNRLELDYQKDIYRVSALWVKNSKWEILLAQRAFTKRHDPWKWWPAVAWTCDKWDTYKSCILRETEEEIWIKITNPVKYKKVRKISTYNYFTQWYHIILDKDISDFIKEAWQVENLKWFTKDEIKRKLKEEPDIYFWSIGESFLLDL